MASKVGVFFGFMLFSCSITLYFFAKEGEDCILSPTKEELLPSIRVEFQQGLGQKFRQASGTGIDLSMFDEAELVRLGETGIHPLAIKAEATPSEDGSTTNSQITQAVFEKEKGEYQVKVVKQILWVNGMRYELQEIYGIGNSVDGADFDGNDPGKECVICLSEPRDTTVLPCRHMVPTLSLSPHTVAHRLFRRKPQKNEKLWNTLATVQLEKPQKK